MAILAALSAAVFPALAQEADVMRAALYISGAAEEEEVDQTVLERVEAFKGRIIKVNRPSRRAGELLSAYQLASLEDYRRRNGDILSWEELALVDGFGKEAVEALKPFLSLDSETLPGAVDTVVRHQRELLLRYAGTGFGAKFKWTAERWQAGAAWRGKDFTFHADADLGRHRVLIGDYHLRTGQGIAHWSGFSMENLSTVEAFIRRATGIRPGWSFSSASLYRGLAWEYARGPIQGSLFADIGGRLGTRVEGLWRAFQVGFTASIEKGGPVVSTDGRLNWKGMDLAAEFAWKNRSFGGIMAGSVKLADAFRLAFQGRALPSRFSGKKAGEYALAAGLGYKASSLTASFTLDAALVPKPDSGETGRRQLKAYAQARWQMTPAWALAARYTGRYRNYEDARTGLRLDILFSGGPWCATGRLEGAYCTQTGLLAYCEGGYNSDKLSGYLRVTGFLVNHWNARIYCYERDAPGTFSVPAYNGRGWAASFTGKWKIRWRRLTARLYLRAACRFRAGESPKPSGSVQLQLQI